MNFIAKWFKKMRGPTIVVSLVKSANKEDVNQHLEDYKA